MDTLTPGAQQKKDAAQAEKTTMATLLFEGLGNIRQDDQATTSSSRLLFEGMNIKMSPAEEQHKTQEPKRRPPLPQKIAEPQPIPETDAEVLRLLEITPERSREIAAMPQDITLETGEVVKNPEWLASRRPNGIPRFTGSVFGELLGYSPYKKQDAGLNDLINPTFTGNAFTKWGFEHEDIACDKFEEWLAREYPSHESQVNHFGLLIDAEFPFLAYSPDGDVTMTSADGVVSHALLEIKCPGSPAKRFLKKSNEPIYGMHDWPNGQRGPAPINYWFQCQLGCRIFKRDYAFFVIWIPSMIQVFRIDYDESYFLRKSLPSARDVFFNKFLPKLRDDSRSKIAARQLWDSVFVQPKAMPQKLLSTWNASLETWKDGGKLIALKDTGGTHFKNKLLSPTTFSYAIPKNAPILQDLQADAGRSKKMHLVRLYKTTCAADHYLGEWLVQDVVPSSTGTSTFDVILWRNSKQTEVHEDAAVNVYRSISETHHHQLLNKILKPVGFDVFYEPEQLVAPVHRAVVIGGRDVDWAGTSYSIDFVAINYYTGRRYCFESKASEDGFDKEALEKARFLRCAGNLVFVIIGKEPKIFSLGKSNADEKWMTFEEFARVFAKANT
jgi:hypothetical protein